MRLDLVARPSGSSKSTFVERVIAPRRSGLAFVNADVIDAREPFIAETVFSHPSKLDLIGRARVAGYIVALHVPRDTASFASGFPDGPCHCPEWTPSVLAGGWPTQT